MKLTLQGPALAQFPFECTGKNLSNFVLIICIIEPKNVNVPNNCVHFRLHRTWIYP